jgi:hypothetical protein
MLEPKLPFRSVLFRAGMFAFFDTPLAAADVCDP